jgi:parvulin-like peptidyl-prolyl isomerase
MFPFRLLRPLVRRWRLLGAALVLGGLGTGLYFCSDMNAVPEANAQQRPNEPTLGVAAAANAAGARDAGPVVTVPADYYQRHVAYLNGSEPITRAELGEYLIPRCGPEKLDLLMKRKIIDRACKMHGVEVTASEVEAAFAEHLRGMNIARDRFVREVLKGYHKNLMEWKEDVLRPRLQLAKLVRDRVQVSDQDLQWAFEARYGERVQCRFIFWPIAEEQKARDMYESLRSDDLAFSEAARMQPWGSLGAGGGRVKPFGRHTLVDNVVENIAFTLQPGQVSELIKLAGGEGGLLLIKCDARLPADTTASREAKRDELMHEVLERKIEAAIPEVVFQMLKEANGINYAVGKEDENHNVIVPPRPEVLTDPNAKVLGVLFGKEGVSREELGEFLVQRYGGERLEMLVNKRIVDRACKAAGIVVTDADVEADVEEQINKLPDPPATKDSRPMTKREAFVKYVLNAQGKNLYEWKEDWARPRLQMSKLVASQVKATEDDIKMAFDAYHGEKVECRMILWPKGVDEQLAIRDYPTIRDSEQEFARKARLQPVGSLAGKGGKIDPIHHHTTGNEALEKAAFSLKPGEVSELIGTPEGVVVIKCDAHYPAETNVSLEQERARLTQEVLYRKTQLQIPETFAKLREQANARLMLKDPSKAEDLAASVQADLQPPQQPAPRPGMPPQPAGH